MAFSSPNYTQTPNDFFDDLLKTLKEGELRVILIIIRQTFGWKKKADRISLSQLAEKTGMERKSVCRSLNSLIEKGLVKKHKFGVKGKERCYFELIVEDSQVDDIEDDGELSDEEMELISNNSYQCPKDTRPVSERHPPQCPKDTHKRKSSKENIKNDDDDREKKVGFSSEKNKHPVHDESNITVTKTNGQQEHISISEVYTHLLPHNFSTATIQEAIKRTRETKTPINNIKKYIIATCRQIETVEQTPEKLAKKPKNKPVMENPSPVKSNEKTITMAEFLKKRGLTL